MASVQIAGERCTSLAMFSVKLLQPLLLKATAHHKGMPMLRAFAYGFCQNCPQTICQPCYIQLQAGALLAVKVTNVHQPCTLCLWLLVRLLVNAVIALLCSAQCYFNACCQRTPLFAEGRQCCMLCL